MFKYFSKYICILLISLSFFTSGFVPGEVSPPDETPKPQVTVIHATNFGVTPPLSEIEIPESTPTDITSVKEIPRPLRTFPDYDRETQLQQDAALQPKAPNQINMLPFYANFEGISNTSQSSAVQSIPPDTNGDVGMDRYIQIVNVSFAIYDKLGNKLYGPAPVNVLFQTLPSSDPCYSHNDGDPVVLYDQIADRWLISQFALSPTDKYTNQCIAISQTPDPTGAWYAYSFYVDENFSDYPKFGVWTDGYYMSANMFNWSLNWIGAKAVAFERAKMLTGDPSAAQIQFNFNSTGNPEIYGLLPADLDGSTLPPTGAPNPFVEIFDDAWGSITPSGDHLRIYNFHVDWTTPGNSTFTNATNPTTAAFDSNMCTYNPDCIPQPAPSTTPLDALSNRLMYRLQYRNFGDYQTMVVNHTVDTNGSDHAGVRWYELRDSGSGWGIYQQGTYSPDADHRWMGSIAMNGSGDIALGYSVSSVNVYPSIRVTGRYASDSLNTLPIAETSIIAGSGYQTHSSHRWGDYSAMSVDPVDDCTFWYTQEYYQTTSTAGWQTRIAAFKLHNCNAKTEIVYPYNGQAIGMNTRILVSVENVDYLTGVNLTIDSGAPIDITSNFDGQYYYYDWDISSVSPGQHSLDASASDQLPETFASQTITVTTVSDNIFLPFTVR